MRTRYTIGSISVHACLVTCVVMACLPLVGCGGAGALQNPPGGTGDSGNLKVSFDAQGGNYAVARDDEGNEYTFRAREGENDELIITEANVSLVDGGTLKTSMDEQGRPVNFRHSNNSNADVVYSGDSARVRYTDASGGVAEGSADVGAARKLPNQKGRTTLQTRPTDRTEALRRAFDEYQTIARALFELALSPDSPLVGSDLAEAADRIARIAQGFDVQEVEERDLEDVTLDEVPSRIQALAGNTYVMFDAEGLCMEQTGVANRLTFDLHGVLQSEFDRNVVFPDFGLSETRESGITINYSTGTTVDLTPSGELDFKVFITPVFTGTSIDDFGNIVIERRFTANSIFQVETPFGPDEAEVEQLFDAALVDGQLSSDGSLLEFNLLLVDLNNENPVRRIGKVRYHNQNSPTPVRAFSCDLPDAASNSGISCSPSANVSELFAVEFLADKVDSERDLRFEWFVSDGLGIISGDPFAAATEVLPTGPGVIQVSLIVTDLGSGASNASRIFTCESEVGGVLTDQPTDPNFLYVECPPGVAVGKPAYFFADGYGLSQLSLPEWVVVGSSHFIVTNPFGHETEVLFYSPGRFNVAYTGIDSSGQKVFAHCEVAVGNAGYDECELNAWYGDGICDKFCPSPDPDCGSAALDFCEQQGYYGDGVCDTFCPNVDPDCQGNYFDICADLGLYANGACDVYCPTPDPDCATTAYDICEDLGWYGDGICDFCPRPDSDCGGQFIDYCAQNGWYGDGKCDQFCPQLDPDCSQYDYCSQYGLYGDGYCDSCTYPDPDCGGSYDQCAAEGRYGNGACESWCSQPDPDCGDYCVEHGLYGDGICDSCPYPDPDCSDLCAQYGYYGDAICDSFCPFPDPDCNGGDVCTAAGYYGDGPCDAFCAYPDPDCGSGNDICTANGYYGDGTCDSFCAYPDPDCSGNTDLCSEAGLYNNGVCEAFCLYPDADCLGGGDLCAEYGYYGDGICDTFCLQVDSDCYGNSGDVCAELGYYGDGYCDSNCTYPDPDCDGLENDICAYNGWYGDGICDEFCVQPDPDCGG